MTFKKTSATIVDITDVAPNKELIELLHNLLAEAESGELRTLVVACGYRGDVWGHGWSIDPRSSPRSLIGESALLHHDVVNRQALNDGGSVLSEYLGEL